MVLLKGAMVRRAMTLAADNILLSNDSIGHIECCIGRLSGANCSLSHREQSACLAIIIMQ
eukprot:scaffold157008_cov25-Prasinocladus_malaysianus.AAC.1